jgi:hypothetical protein
MSLLGDEDYPSSSMDLLCNEVLTVIEMNEHRLLNWGFVDVRSDLETQISPILDELTERGHKLWEDVQPYNVTPEMVLQNLLDRRLIFKSSHNGYDFYRSRFAEAIRLLALLRQRFTVDDWQTASRLVSDIKIDIKRRLYPKRDIAYSEVREELRKLGASSTYIDAIQCLLSDGSSSYIKLARFQKEAIFQQYRILHPTNDTTDRRDRALVIGAGTGSGKTKAFYIPAMAEIGATMTTEAYTRALAIYPRIELLKDQLSEAFLEARKLDEFLTQNKPRTITLGAYYGETPYSAKSLLANSWEKAPERRRVDGWECPFFRCPSKECEHHPLPLVWYKEDVEREIKENESKEKRYGIHARLRCPECGFKIEGNQLLLTREQLKRTPPDILFITTEMLNRCMLRPGEHRLIGVDLANKPLPRMLLLDEIHTYEGLSGTHVAYLLRRWRYARRRYHHEPLCCVGLSATLNNAETFFAKLTDIPANLVSYIRPERTDMEEEGAEYHVALKGDPVSATTLLSTSVQTVMLLARILDRSSDEPSHGAYGQKVFAFTDKLDVINRWFYIQRDAESNGLSAHRKPLWTDRREVQLKKRQAGQDWQICEEIGHPLEQPLRLDLTSSQNRGVNPNANVIIATSALEVGFNDSTVGIVVQHKAPHSLASLLQRKGRAGRERKMRPWMVVVTSAYGRDRWAFQHAEHLFNPMLNDLHLPIENYYVRKIQAVFAFMDWLSLELKNEPHRIFTDLWTILSRDDGKRASDLYPARQVICNLINAILDGGAYREKLQSYLQQALGLRTKREVESLLWDEPRSLMFEVLPTLLRQLESGWQQIAYNNNATWKVKPRTDSVPNQPLPDFVTPNLFSDLKSVNIPIKLPLDPPATTVRYGKKTESAEQQKQREEMLPLLQCMTEFAPGHISKRFVRQGYVSRNPLQKEKNEAHWLALPPDNLLVNDILPIDKLKITYDDAPSKWRINNKDYYLYRPRAYELEHMPGQIKDSTTAYLQWQSRFTGKSSLQVSDQSGTSVMTGKLLPLARNSAWQDFFTAIYGYTHDEGCWAEVARLATGVQIDMRYTTQRQARRLWLQFKKNNQDAAIGFINQVDALQFQIRPLDVEQLIQHPEWVDLYAHLRPEYFLYRVQKHAEIIKARLSRFEIEWLWVLELSMLVATAVATPCTLQEAAQVVSRQRSLLAKRTMDVIFQSQQIDTEEKEKAGRLQEKLQEFIKTPELVQALESCETVLWEEHNQDLSGWLQQCYASSLGHTLFAALTHLIADIDPDDLAMDVDGDSIWISEVVPGGIGIISQLTKIFESKAHEFDLQMRQTLRHCNRQEISSQLGMIAELIKKGDQDLQNAFQEVRQAVALPEQEKALQQLRSLLDQRGAAVNRELVVALQTKFLRSNSDSDTDELIARLTDLWRSEEQRLGCAIDLRVIAVAALRRDEIEQPVKKALSRIGDNATLLDTQIFNVLQSLLWLPCVNSCPDCIEEYSPYQNLVKPSRQLLKLLLPSNMVTVTYGQPQWREHVLHELADHYAVLLTCEQEQLPQCTEHIQELLVEKVEIGSLQYFYPVIESITRDSRLWAIELRIWEFTHG